MLNLALFFNEISLSPFSLKRQYEIFLIKSSILFSLNISSMLNADILTFELRFFVFSLNFCHSPSKNFLYSKLSCLSKIFDFKNIKLNEFIESLNILIFHALIFLNSSSNPFVNI